MSRPEPTPPPETPNRPEAILFDLDGVLLDSMPWHVRAWQEAFAELGIGLEEEFIYLHEGAIERSELVDILRGQGLDLGPGLEGLIGRQIEIFTRSYADRVELYPQTRSALTRLSRAGLRLALVTSSSRAVIRRCFDPGLLERFEVVVSGDQVSQGKPHPQPYLIGLERLGLGAGRAAAVENAPAGIRSAKAAGLFCYGLTTTLLPDQLAGADAVFGSLGDLIENLLGDGAEPPGSGFSRS